ncbi:hypothetical protein F2Q70_00027605 [Brassica cretica]|uniref:Copine C-terminal domain-containing protein n=1 Tax=Brassica cretica TaxID=69181 RepID=A0A8S9LF25_BRACR|nr:hypothetical protein F2Q70_00027605 [Brassica cretica]
METIVDESSYALSIVIVNVGDVPWADMRKFDDMIPKREFNNIKLPANILSMLGKKIYVISMRNTFKNAKLLYWAEINGTSCDLYFPDVYVGDVNWNAEVDTGELMGL